MKSFDVFSDGSCLKNPGGPGGWAVIIRGFGGLEFTFAGGVSSTTNNRMELLGVIFSLEMISLLEGPSQITIYSDSMYVVNCCTGTYRSKFNTDLWIRYNAAASKHGAIKRVWVKGHDGHAENERVDKLAYAAMKEQVANE